MHGELLMLSRLGHLLSFFYEQRIRGFDPPDDRPWMDDEGIARFKEELGKATGYLEYGSGGTTVLADRAGIPTVSVESDPYYARAVRSRLSAASAVRQVVVDIGITAEWGTPIFSSGRKGRRYVHAPDGLSQFPDFILVDGRYRVACALVAARKAHELQRNATVMVDDYVDREGYRAMENVLGSPSMVGRSAVFAVGDQPVPLEAIERAYLDWR
jgi:hypothetical protein